MQHAKMSASGSARWLNCPGSVKAEESFKDKGSSFAQEGTCAHELSEICLKTGDSPDKYIGQTLNDAPEIEVDADMAEHVAGYVAYVKSLGGDLFVEERVDFSPWVPEGFGTSDAIVVCGDVCNVVDLKYGKGLLVCAENNTQAMLYALGVYNDYGYLYDNIKTFRLHVYQPRMNNFSEWDISLVDLLKWGEWVKLQADLALEDDAPRNPSDKACQWCKAKAACKALYDYTENIIAMEFDDLDELESPETLGKDKLRNVLESKKLITSWLDAVEAHVKDQLLNGEKVKGFKMVEGRSVRKWVDADLALETMLEVKTEDELFEKKFLTPAKAEKLLGKKDKSLIADCIIKPSGAPTLAPESDKRPAIGDVTDCFEEIS